MNIFERSSHPSAAQINALLEYLENEPRLAKSCAKTQCARDKVNKEWEKISLKLNNIEGTIKTYKKWMKYWSDKKCAVKRKAASRAAARDRTDGGTEEMPELSKVEERILLIMDGDAFSVSDRNLSVTPVDGSAEECDLDCFITPPIRNTDRSSTDDADIAQLDPTEALEMTFNIPDNSQKPYPHGQPLHRPRLEVPSPTRFRTQAHPYTTTNPRRQGRGRPLPPSRRQMSKLTDKILQMEERRLAMEERTAAILERSVEMDRLRVEGAKAMGDGMAAMGKGMAVMGEGLKALAELIKK